MVEELREYLLDFADGRATEELNGDMARGVSLGKLRLYYEAKPELAEYTVDQELSRMAYEVRAAPASALSSSSASSSSSSSSWHRTADGAVGRARCEAALRDVCEAGAVDRATGAPTRPERELSNRLVPTSHASYSRSRKVPWLSIRNDPSLPHLPLCVLLF